MPCLNSDLDLTLTSTAPIALHAQLHCAGGELLALVGPSGSGKSTLLRLIAGLARPAQGHIQFGSACWFDSAKGVHLSPQRRRVGFVPQHYGLFPHMTALGNVMAGLHDVSAKEREARARRWMQKVHLHGLEKRRPAELSGGQQQRVALARALVREPSILLLDEPFSAVDRVTSEILYLELAELKRELALPIIMVTHDLNEALLLADRMTLLAQGRTLQSGVPRAVMAKPVSEIAARQLGIRNIFDATVLRHDPGAGFSWVRSGDTELACPLAAGVPVGSKLRWMIPTNGVRLGNLVNGGLPASNNTMRVTILNVLQLGDQARITAQLPGVDAPLSLQVSLQLAEALGLRPGIDTDVVLREEQLHVFPPD